MKEVFELFLVTESERLIFGSNIETQDLIRNPPIEFGCENHLESHVTPPSQAFYCNK